MTPFKIALMVIAAALSNARMTAAQEVETPETAREIPPAVQAVIDSTKEARPKELERLQVALADAEREVVAGRRGRISSRFRTATARRVHEGRPVYEFATPEAKRETMLKLIEERDRLRQSIHELEINNPVWIATIDPWEPEPKTGGRLRRGNGLIGYDYRTVQIIDEATMLVSILNHTMRDPTPREARFLTRPVLVPGPTHERLLLIRGYAARGLTDDRPIEFDEEDVFFVAGTHTYETVNGGTNAVPVLEWIDREEWLEEIREAMRPDVRDSKEGDKGRSGSTLS